LLLPETFYLFYTKLSKSQLSLLFFYSSCLNFTDLHNTKNRGYQGSL